MGHPWRELRVYLAAPGNGMDRAKDAMACVRARGGVITHDWTEEWHEPDEFEDERFYQEYLQRCALNDHVAIRAADVLILLEPDEKNGEAARGAWTELGIALELGIPVYVLEQEHPGHSWKTLNIFTNSPRVRRFNDLTELLEKAFAEVV